MSVRFAGNVVLMLLLVAGFLLPGTLGGVVRTEGADLPDAKPVPAMQVVPLPYQQASFEYQGRELTRYHFGPGLERPFWYPMIGPEGKSLTRMGHPRDPHSHRHHNSVWISHEKVSGVNFWSDGTGSKIVCRQVLQYEDGPQEASMLCLNAWQDKAGKTVMIERRRTAVQAINGEEKKGTVPICRNGPEGASHKWGLSPFFPGGEWLMVIDLQLEAPASGPVTLGETPFGLIGVRMAKTIGVNDGGGRILNSAGHVNEAHAFRQPAKWVDYSGPVTDRGRGGIAMLDHPSNPDHPTPFHVRDDGWMGASLTLKRPLVLQPGRPLRLRYGLWVHPGVPTREQVETRWGAFAKQPLVAEPSRGE